MNIIFSFYVKLCSEVCYQPQLIRASEVQTNKCLSSFEVLFDSFFPSCVRPPHPTPRAHNGISAVISHGSVNPALLQPSISRTCSELQRRAPRLLCGLCVRTRRGHTHALLLAHMLSWSSRLVCV